MLIRFSALVVGFAAAAFAQTGTAVMVSAGTGYT